MSFPKLAPHIVLGVPSGADRGQLAVSFASASRRVKAGGNQPFTVTDLTMALSVAEDALSPHANFRLTYTVPANPTVVGAPIAVSIGGRVVSLDDDLCSVDVERLAASEIEALARLALGRSMRALFEWRWEESLEFARFGLKISRNEQVRDEALNLLAASRFAVGDHERAMNALKKAVEGDWNPSLQGNLALVAWDSQPEIAVRHMAYVVGDAARLSVSQRLEAAVSAVSLWQEAQATATGSTDEDDHAPPSPELLDGMASLMLDREISEEQFYRLGSFLARFSPMALSSYGGVSKSRHMGTVSGELIRARASGFGEYLERLVVLGGQVEPGVRPWIDSEIEGFVVAIASWFGDGEADKEHLKIAVSRTFAFMEHGLRLTTFDRVCIVGQMIRHLGEVLDGDSSPADQFVTWWHLGKSSIHALSTEEQAKGRDFLVELFEVAGNVLGLLHHRALISSASNAEQRYNEIARLRWINSEARAMLHAIVVWCREAEATYRSVLPVVTNRDLKSEMTRISGAIASMRVLAEKR